MRTHTQSVAAPPHPGVILGKSTRLLLFAASYLGSQHPCFLLFTTSYLHHASFTESVVEAIPFSKYTFQLGNFEPRQISLMTYVTHHNATDCSTSVQKNRASCGYFLRQVTKNLISPLRLRFYYLYNNDGIPISNILDFSLTS